MHLRASSDESSGTVRLTPVVKPPVDPADGAWVVLKEGLLIKTKKLKTITSVKQRMFVLRHQETSGKAKLDYYDGKIFKGSIDLTGSRTVPLPGSCRFEIHTPGRVFHLQTEHDAQQARNWVLHLQTLCLGPVSARRTSFPARDQLVYFQVGDELLPLKSLRSSTRRRGKTPQHATVPECFDDEAPALASKLVDDSAVVMEVQAGGFTSGARSLVRTRPARVMDLRHSWPKMHHMTDDAPVTARALASISGVLFRMTDLQLGDILGEGFFGRVYKAQHRRTGEYMVVKRLKASEPAAVAGFLQEISLLKSFHHPNVLSFIGIFCQDNVVGVTLATF